LSLAERDRIRREWLNVVLAVMVQHAERGDVAFILQLVVSHNGDRFAAELLAMLVAALRAETSTAQTRALIVSCNAANRGNGTGERFYSLFRKIV